MEKILTCQNVHCPHGIDGQPKVYPYCDECNPFFLWKKIACCIGCYEQWCLNQLDETKFHQQKQA